MSEKEEIYERKNFWKYLALASIFVSLLFGLGMCSPIYHSKYKVPNYLEKGNQEIRKQDEGYNYDGNEEIQNLAEGQKKTSNYRIDLPSSRYLVVGKPVSLNKLALRWHCSVDEIEASNPNLEGQNPNTPIKPEEPINVPSGKELQGFEKAVFDLTNKERTKAGLPAFKGDYAQLNNSSRAKSQDMIDKNYFSHNSPTYGSPFDMMKTFDVSYKSAGENIAIGQRTPEEVVQAWMNSSGHRANILNSNFNYMGVGFVKGNNKYAWTQQFVGR